MTWVALAYGAVAYWHFRATLRTCQSYDSPGTIVLNAVLALTIGPCLLIPAVIFDWLYRH